MMLSANPIDSCRIGDIANVPVELVKAWRNFVLYEAELYARLVTGVFSY